MIKLKINNQTVELADGLSVLKAAERIGVEIPTMCFKDGFGNHPSCMLCLVKDVKTGKLHPSCALPSAEGMEIITDDEEIHEARKESLELLLSDHVGDCEAPCRTACPAYMDIPQMNRLIATGEFEKAIKVVKEEIAIPLILGYICPAPCENACHRSVADKPVKICELKRIVAEKDLQSDNFYLPQKGKSSGKKVAVIGSGPAGLTAAYHLLIKGHETIIYDKNPEAGGTLRYDIPEEKLPNSAIDQEVKTIEKLGAQFNLNQHIDKKYFEKIRKEFDAIIIASGNFADSNMEEFGFEKTQFGLKVAKDTFQVAEGIFACGNVFRSRKMAVTSVAQAKQAAHSVDAYLRGDQAEKIYRMFNSRFGKIKAEEVEEYLKESSYPSSASGYDLLQKKERSPEALEGRLSEEQVKQACLPARQEAQRCMHCDCRKPHTCKLRIYADEYKADRRKFIFGDRKLIQKSMEHELIVYEPEKCIRCNLCVEISEKQKGHLGFTSIGRGFEVRMKAPLNKSLKDIFNQTAIDCAVACPTGAISRK
jgi:ferredoxin